MKVLVTGATGYVGRHLILHLKSHGHSITAVSRGTVSNLPAADVLETLEISSETNWAPLLRDVDCLVHLADGFNAFERYGESVADKRAGERLKATLHLARAAVDSEVKNLIYISTIKAMCGAQAAGRLTEESPARPTSLYGRLKLDAEQKIAALARGSGTRAVCLRVPIVFGPHAGGNSARLLRLADSPWPLPFSKVCNRRSFIAISSLVDAILKVVEDDRPDGGVYLVQDGALSTPDLIRYLRRGCGRPARLYPLPAGLWSAFQRLPKLGEIACRLTDSLEFSDQKFRKNFAWSPPSDLGEVLEQISRECHDSRLSE